MSDQTDITGQETSAGRVSAYDTLLNNAIANIDPSYLGSPIQAVASAQTALNSDTDISADDKTKVQARIDALNTHLAGATANLQAIKGS